MDHISKHLNPGRKELEKTLSKSQEKMSRKTGLPHSWISALFLKFQHRYLHKWSSAIDGDEKAIVKEWAEYLGDLSPDQLKQGFDSWSEDWPPTAPEFRSACLKKQTNEFGLDYVPEYYREPITDKTRLLSSTDREKRRQIAKGHIQKIKELFKGY